MEAVVGVQRRRVAELIVDNGLETARRGSGYRVSTTVVITAGHVVRDARSVLVRFNADLPEEWSSAAVVRFADPGCDLGAVSLEEPDGEQVELSSFGRLGDRPAVVAFEAVGFPRFKLRSDQHTDQGSDPVSRYRDTAHVHGMIASLSNWREGTLELVLDPPARAPEPDRSPWEGMSGAAVWCAGRIVGVVSEHHPGDGLNRLAAVPFGTVYRQLPRRRWLELAGVLGSVNDPSLLPDVAPPTLAEIVDETYAGRIEEIAPLSLEGRDKELAALTGFCAGEEAYQWWRADPWYGKTALASWLVLHPPAGVRVVWFFITGRLAGQADSAAYTEALIAQLAGIVGEPNPPASVLPERHGQRIRLLEKAAQQVDAAGGRLLLVVDGLDEDRGKPPDGPTSIASVLPRRPPRGLRVLVTSRPHPGIPLDVKQDHPLRGCTVVKLTRSDRAQQIEQEAKLELSEHLASGDPLKIDILGFISASGGGLTRTELAELIGRPRYEVDQRVSGGFGRSLTVRTPTLPEPGPGEPVLIFGHETLREQADEQLAGEIRRYRRRIDDWVTGYRQRGWPDDSPRYVFRPYARLLRSTRNTQLLGELATDRQRHDRMLRRTSGDANAYQEIVEAHQLLLDPTSSSDIPRLVLLAFEKHRLAARNRSIPLDLPAVWARLGQTGRAIALARSFDEPEYQALALTAVARERAAAGAVDDAERIARTIPGAEEAAQALAELVRVMADAGRMQDADRIASSIVVREPRAHAFIAVAAALAATGRVADAEQAAARVNHVWRSAALTAIVNALAAGGRLADAERLTRSIGPQHRRPEAVVAVARALAAAGRVDDAERITRLIADETWQRIGFVAIAEALAVTDRIEASERILRAMAGSDEAAARAKIAEALAAAGKLTAAEQLAGAMPDVQDRLSIATATALAAAGRIAEAEQAVGKVNGGWNRDQVVVLVRAMASQGSAVDAVRIARGIISDESHYAEVLTAAADGLAAAGYSAEAQRTAEDAEQAARGRSAPADHAHALTNIAQALASAGHVHEAERVGRHVDNDRRATTLAVIAQTLADSGRLDDSARLLDAAMTGGTVDPDRQRQARAALAWALATAHRVADAEDVAHRDPETDGRAQSLIAVARAAAGMGALRQAERIAHGMGDDDGRARTLGAIALALAESGRLADAARITAELKQTVDGSPEPSNETVLALVQALTAVGHTDQAEEVAHRMTGQWQPRALAAAAQVAATTGDDNESVRLANDALRMLGAGSQELQAEVLGTVTQVLIRCGHINDAESVASQIIDRSAQAQTRTIIAAAAARAGDVATAERIAHGIAPEQAQARASAAIARSLMATGHGHDAERISSALLLGPAWPDAVGLLTARHIQLQAARHPDDLQWLTDFVAGEIFL